MYLSLRKLFVFDSIFEAMRAMQAMGRMHCILNTNKPFFICLFFGGNAGNAGNGGNAVYSSLRKLFLFFSFLEAMQAMQAMGAMQCILNTNKTFFICLFFGGNAGNAGNGGNAVYLS